MLCRQLIISSFLLLMLTAHASKSDSLLHAFYNAKLPIVKQDISNKLFWAHLHSNPDSAYIFAKLGLSLCDTSNYKSLATFHNNIGIYHYYTDGFDSANYYYNWAIKYTQLSGDSSQMAKCLNNLAIIKDIQGKYQEAELIYQQSLELHKNRGNIKQVAESLGNLAVVQKLMGNYEKSISSHLECIAIHDSINNPEGKAYDYNNIGLIKDLQGKKMEAIEYFNKSLTLFDELNIPVEKANVWLNIANLYSAQGLQAIALSYYEQAIEVYQEKKMLSGEAICFLDIAEIQENNNDFEMAEQNLVKASKLFETIGYTEKHFHATLNYLDLVVKQERFEQADSLLNTATAIATQLHTPKTMGMLKYRCGTLALTKKQYGTAKNCFYDGLKLFGELHSFPLVGEINYMLAKSYEGEKNYSAAIQKAETSLFYSKKSGEVLLQQKAANLLYSLYWQTQNYKKAASSLLLFSELKDSIFNIENIQKMSAFQLKLDFNTQLDIEQNQTRETEILLNSEINSQKKVRNLILLFALLLFFVLLITYAEYLRKKKAYTLLAKKSDELAKMYIKQLSSKKEKGNKKNLNNTNKTTILKKLDKFLIKEKMYLKPKLKLTDVAKKLGTNSNYLSQAINTEYNKNFNQLINEYRIREACVLIHYGKHKQLSIEGISKSVGFNNRTSFIDAFKKVNGVLPSFYINSLDKTENDFI